MNLKILLVFGAIVFIKPIYSQSLSNNSLPFSKGFEFIENKGQWDSTIIFRAQQQTLDLQIGNNFINYFFYNKTQWNNLVQHPRNKDITNIPQSLDIFALRFNFLNTGTPIPELIEPHKQYYNFYQGNEREHWAFGAKSSNQVTLRELYEGISLKYISTDEKLKYEFWLQPKANPNAIQMQVLGATKIFLEYGDLYIETPEGIIKENKPYAYQFIEGKQVQVPVAFKLNNNIISYSVNESYNSNYPLVIDPELVFLTYSGSSADNFGCTATPGENGMMYIGGVTTSAYSTIPTGKYPVTTGAFQLNFAGGCPGEGPDRELKTFFSDITLSKYSSDGTTLLYATYLGGSCNDVPHSLVVDDSSNLIVMGDTYSHNFPVSKYAYDTSQNGRTDFIITKFNSSGKLIASTYMGGSANDALNYNDTSNFFFGDSYRGDVITNSKGEVFVAAFTQSSNFPTTVNVVQKILKGYQDGVVFKLSADFSKLIWSTYIGGESIDALYSIDIGSNNQIYMSGGTRSKTITSTAGHYNPSNNGGLMDGFICIIDPFANSIVHATYFGTSAYDQIFSLELDKNSNIYVVGQSEGSIPVTPGKYNNPGSHQFLASFEPDLKKLRWSTVWGSGSKNVDLTINAFMVDDCERIYVSSWGGAVSLRGLSSTDNMPLTSGAFQEITDGSDFYLMLLEKNATGLLYATYMGGLDPQNEGDHVDGGTSRFDKKGVVYQSMCASCPLSYPATTMLSDLKTTANAFSPKNLSPRCSNAALKFDFRIKIAQFTVEADSCESIFHFYNKTTSTKNFYWKFPNGDTSHAVDPVKFIDPKYYGDSILLIIEPGTNCEDTAVGFVNLPDPAYEVKIPNVFAPNNDGLNDFFLIEGPNGQCDETEVSIFNRWGQLYFEDRESHFRWDGKDNLGIEAPEGVYFFMLRTTKKKTHKTIEHHGTITLIRGNP